MTEHGLENTETLPVVSAAFRLWAGRVGGGGRFDPDLVTARLGVEPTYRYRTGDPTPSGLARRRGPNSQPPAAKARPRRPDSAVFYGERRVTFRRRQGPVSEKGIHSVSTSTSCPDG